MAGITSKLVLMILTSLSAALGISIYSTYHFDLQWVRSWLLETVLEEASTLAGGRLTSDPWQADWARGPYWWTTHIQVSEGKPLTAEKVKIHVLPHWGLPWRFEIHTEKLMGSLESPLRLPVQPHPKHALLSKLQPWLEDKLQSSHFEWHFHESALEFHFAPTASLSLMAERLVWNSATQSLHMKGTTVYKEPGLRLSINGEWSYEGDQLRLQSKSVHLDAKGGSLQTDEPLSLVANLMHKQNEPLALQHATLTTEKETIHFSIDRLKNQTWRMVVTESIIEASRWHLPGNLGSLQGSLRISGMIEGDFERLQVESTARSEDILWKLPDAEPLQGHLFLHLQGNQLERMQFESEALTLTMKTESECFLKGENVPHSLVLALQKNLPNSLHSLEIQADHYDLLQFPLEKLHCNMRQNGNAWKNASCTARLYDGSLDFSGSPLEMNADFRLQAKGIELSQVTTPLELPNAIRLPKSGTLDFQLFGPSDDWTGHLSLKNCRDLELSPLQESLFSLGWAEAATPTSLNTHFRMQKERLELFDLAFQRPEGKLKGQWSLAAGKLEGYLHAQKASEPLSALFPSPESALATLIELSGSLDKPSLAVSKQTASENSVMTQESRNLPE